MTLLQVIKNLIKKDRENLHTSLPGEIVEYDHSKRKAKVKPLIKFRKRDGTFLEYPIITGVPVVFPCSSTASIIFPIKRGDKCLLVFAERSIDEWLFDGRDMEPMIPRLHSISDCVAIPGLQPFTQSNPADEGNVEIHNGSQKVVIKQNGDIEVGGSNMKELITREFFSVYNSHTHAVSGAATLVPNVQIMDTPVPVPPAISENLYKTRTKVE
jgi:hypothetical protein